MGEMDRRLLPRARDSGHHEAASDRGGERAAIFYSLIHTARLNGVDPQAWLADVLARINDHKINDLAALLPWRWAADPERCMLAA
jgi:transposase